MKINPNQFDSIIKKGYSLDHVYLLELIKDEIDITQLIDNSIKISALYQTLIRKNLIIKNKLTLEGKHLLEFIESDDAIKFTKLKIEISDFDTWWISYPATDCFTYKNRLFEGARGLRINKISCIEKFNKIILEGEYTPQQLIKSLQYDVNQKKKESFKTGSNKLSFMQNSLTYLNQHSFEPYIKLSELVIKEESDEPKETKSLF